MPLARACHNLGQDEECDLIFLDDAFLNGRVVLDLTGTVPKLSTTGEVKAVLDGQVVEGGRVLEPYQSVEVGATRFALGIVGEPWPEPPKPEQASQPETPVGPSAEPDGSPVAMPAEAANPVTLTRSVRIARFLLRRRLPLLIGGGVLLLASAITYLATRPVRDHAGEARGIIAGLALTEVRAREEGGDLVVEGFVPTEKEKEALTESLSGLGLRVKNAAITGEETFAAIRQVLEISDVNYIVEIGKGGKAMLKGVDDDSLRIVDIADASRQGVKPGVAVETGIQGSVVVKAYLSRLLAAKDLVHKIKVEIEKGRVYGLLVTGRMNDSELAAWGQIKASFQSQFGFQVGERWTEQLSPTLQQFAAAFKELDEGLLSVTPGEMAHISLRGGRKCFEGGRLRSGPYVQSIRKDRLVLSVGSVEEIYTIKKGRR